MGNRNNYPINVDSFRKEIKKRGLSLKEASEAIGRAESYLNHSTTTGFISKPTITILEKMFNLPYEAYKLEEPELEEQSENENIEGQMVFQLPGMTKDELWKVIYTAVYEAVKKARSE